jgi:hypothetical protein
MTAKANPPARHVPREFMRTGLDDGPLLPVPASEPRDELCSEGQYAGDQVMPCDCDGPEPPATLPLSLELRDRVMAKSESMIRAYVRHRREYGWYGDESDVASIRALRAALAELRALGGDRG